MSEVGNILYPPLKYTNWEALKQTLQQRWLHTGAHLIMSLEYLIVSIRQMISGLKSGFSKRGFGNPAGETTEMRSRLGIGGVSTAWTAIVQSAGS